jgi:hypothetical protein
MGLFDSFEAFINPTEAQSRARRLDVFGTDNKAVVGGLIVAGAAAAIAAPAVIAGGGIKKAGTAIAGSSLKTKVIAGLTTPIAISYVAGNPKSVTRGAGSLTNFYTNALETANNPSVDNFKDLVTENPVTAGLVTAGVVFASGGPGLLGNVGNYLSTKENTRAVKENTEAALENLLPVEKEISSPPAYVPPNPQSSNLPAAIPIPESPKVTTPVSSTPITPATEVLGKPASTGTKMSRFRTRRSQENRQTVRVNVLNQQKVYIRGHTR